MHVAISHTSAASAQTTRTKTSSHFASLRFSVLRLPYETGPLSAPLPRKIIRLRQDS